MDPPNPGPIDMRHTKLKPDEAALIAGELVKPTWASRNEGIHERVSFEDTLWGFEMAGGAYYNTPLRVAYVRPGSRAELACIKMGDTVLRINGQDTSNLTLQEAHQLVLEAGINLKIVVTSPEDKFNAQYAYEDPLMVDNGLTPEQLKEMELERVRKALERASRCQELPWPWVRRKWIIYRESNCFMVPSKYENKHRDKFPELPSQRLQYFCPADNVQQIKKNKYKTSDDSKNTKENEVKENEIKENPEQKTPNGDDNFEKIEEEEIIEEEAEEEIDEEVEEEVEEEESKEEEEAINQDGSERLEDKTTNKFNENSGLSGENKVENLESDTNNVELQIENLNQKNGTINSIRKDSDQGSVSNYELDNNNNHVVKSKDEQSNENSEQISDDRVIDEIVENSSGLVEVEENVPKSEDDIIDSVLNDSKSKNENER